MDYKLKNLRNPINTKSGIAEFALIALANDFATNGIKSPVAPFTNPGDELRIKNAHVFLPGKKFAKFDLAPQKNQYGYKSVGDTGFKSLNSEVEIFIAGSYVEAHAAVKGLLNQKLIVLVKDSECSASLYYQLGCDCQFAYLSVDFSTGFTNNGVKGFKGTITYDDGPQFYEVAGGPAVLGENAPACPLITVEGATVDSLTFGFNAESYSAGHEAKLFLDPSKEVQAGATQQIPHGTGTVTFTGLNDDQVYYVSISPKDANGVVTEGCGVVGAKTSV